MSGGKGSQQTGSSTTTQTNPLAPYVKGAADYLTPYAQDPNRPYTAPPNPLQTAGYQNLADTGANLGGWPMAKQYDAYGNLITGGGQSPAYPGYSAFAAGTAGPQQTADQVTNNAVNIAQRYADQITGGNLGLSQLGDVASGKFTNASSNPYLRDMVNAALRPVSEQYGTVTAPGLAARFSGGGRYGSGAQDVAEGSARDAFARNLGEISSGLYGNEYRFERGQQDTAAQQLDAARRANYGTAGNLVDQGERTALSAADLNQRGQIAGLAGLDTGFSRGLTTQEAALRDYNNFATGQMIPANANIQAGTGLRDLDTSQLREPYDRVGAYLKAISGGGTTGGSSSTQPIFGNPLTSAVSGATGVLGLGKELGLGSAASSLFGGGGAAATQAGLGALFPGATQTAAGLADYAAIPELASSAAAFAPSAGKGAASFLPAIFSDRRLKEDDRVIGNIGDLPLHSFRYRGDPATRFGFMADEVAKVDPDAVLDTESGYKAVDYLRAARAALK